MSAFQLFKTCDKYVVMSRRIGVKCVGRTVSKVTTEPWSLDITDYRSDCGIFNCGR